MLRSLSWIDPRELSAALVHAGVRRAPRRRSRADSLELRRLRTTAGSGGSEVALDLLEDLGVTSGETGGGETSAPSEVGRAAIGGWSRLPSRTPRPPFHPPQGILETRLKAFFSWAIDVTGSRSLFLTDAEGLVLMEVGASNEMVAATSSFTSLLDRMRSALGAEPRGTVAIDLDPRRILHVIRIDSGLGAHTLGVVAPRPMERDLLEELRAAVTDLLAAVDVEELFGT